MLGTGWRRGAPKRSMVLAACLVGGLLLGWPRADAGDAEVRQLAQLCEGTGGIRRVRALEALRALESTDSRKALEALAGSKDADLAVGALRAITRDDDTGARGKLEKVFEDTKRSTTVRTTAMLGWCHVRKAQGAGRSDVHTYLTAKAGQDQRILAAVAAVEAKLFPTEGE